MSWWLAGEEDQVRKDWLKRFDARYWTVDFPRPMMASVVCPAPASIRVDAVFYQASDLAGLIWSSADTIDHPLLRYETSRDYRGIELRFRWRSEGLIPLDALFGPTLTIEGRDADGLARSWYVRLWNYAIGSPADAQITLKFSSLSGGFLLPAEADPVWAGDIDRMFISLAPPGYTGAATPYPAAIEAWAELTDIVCDGATSTIQVGDAYLPEHNLRAASAYDDQYNITPARLLRNIDALGFRKWLNHYVGMSHHFRLQWRPESARFEVLSAAQPFNVPFLAWHRDLLRKAKAKQITTILSLSYELFDAHSPEAWKQRKGDGSPALTGWVPPSTLLSPAVPAAQTYLERCAAALASLSAAEGSRPHFQIGEPWWWVGPDRAPCVYDDAARALYQSETGLPVTAAVTNIDSAISTTQGQYLAWAGGLLGRSTLAVANAARFAAADTVRLLLFYSPQVTGTASGNLIPLNMPVEWSSPAFDIFQHEDYDFLLEEKYAAARDAKALVSTRLGYTSSSQHYFAGFVLNASEIDKWSNITEAANHAVESGYKETFLWSMPQVLRDGFCYLQPKESAVSFDDVLFPLELGLDAVSEPTFATQVITTAGGHEQRNSNWAEAKLKFEVGSGLRSESELTALMSFYRARRGRAMGFRFHDPLDNRSSLSADPLPTDQIIGTGNGQATRFQLTKGYGGGGPSRRITRPVAGTVRIALSNQELLSGWRLLDGGVVEFDQAPTIGSIITAGFRFDVPVRFGEDSLPLSLAAFRAGSLPPLSLIEIRES